MKPQSYHSPNWVKLFGFTLIELLVVVAVIGILAGILLPALAQAKQKALQTGCISNLKQVGMAIQMYTDDNDGFLPGPVRGSARASYDNTSSEELIYYIAENLGDLPPRSKVNVAEVFVCPGFRRSAPALGSLVGRKCYKLSGDIDPDPASKVLPFGYPISQPLPLKLSSISQYSPPDNIFAITDLDKGNMPSADPTLWDSLPYTPVHGKVRVELYFDWHVAPKAW